MFTVIDAQMAKLRYEEMLREAERERRFANSATVHVNLLSNALSALRAAFAGRTQAIQPTVRRTVAAE